MKESPIQWNMLPDNIRYVMQDSEGVLWGSPTAMTCSIDGKVETNSYLTQLQSSVVNLGHSTREAVRYYRSRYEGELLEFQQVLEHILDNLRAGRPTYQGLEVWVGGFGSEWEPVGNYAVSELSDYRLAPAPMMDFAGYNVPQPIRSARELEPAQLVYVVDLCTNSGATVLPWTNDGISKLALQNGFLHKTKEGAEAHCAALISLNRESLEGSDEK